MSTGYEPVPAHLQKYVEYINNTGHRPLPEATFDDDWEPIGPMVRAGMAAGGWIYSDPNGGIRLRPDLESDHA